MFCRIGSTSVDRTIIHGPSAHIHPGRKGAVAPYQTVLLALLLATISLSASGVAQGQAYYVDPVSGNDGRDGSASSPWKTVPHAAANAASGSTVYLRNGSYGAVSLAGIASARTSWEQAIVFTADAGHTPVFTGLRVAGMDRCYMQFDRISFQCQSGGSGTHAVDVIDASHVKMTNLTVTGQWDDQDNTKITNIGIRVIGTNADVSDVLIENCTITQVSVAAQAGGRIRSGLVVRRNTATKINSSLLRFLTDLKNDNILVEYNNIAEYRGIGDPHGSGLSIRNSNMTIRGNVIRGYGGSGGIRFYQNAANTGGVPPGGYSNILCEGNLIYGSNVSTGIFANHIGHNFIFRNNTFVSKWRDTPASSGRWRYAGTANFGLDPEGTGQNVRIHNNILLGIVGIGESLIDAGLQEDHNLMWNLTIGKLNFQSQPLGANSILICTGYNARAPFGDTHFETPGTFFIGSGSFAQAFDTNVTTPSLDSAFRLASGSVAINAGTSLNASPYCLEGFPRMDADNADPDLGAYEYRAGTPTNRPPVLRTLGNYTATIGEQLRFTVTADDADGDPLTYSATGLPSGATFTGQTFTWTPSQNQVGTHQVTFRATDGRLSDAQTVTITVEGSHGRPTLAAIGNKSVDENATLTFSISASDPDGDPITYSVTGLPSGASFSSRTFRWTPAHGQAGNYQVTFIASDGQNQDSQTITITVIKVNRAPVLSEIGDRSVDQDHALTFNVTASDPDGDPIAYSASGLPAGATLAGGTFSWTPSASQVGPHHITFVASDGDLQDSRTATIFVASTGPDSTAPTVARHTPQPEAIQVSLNNLVTLHVTDAGRGVAPESVVIRVDGTVVYQGDTPVYESATGRCSRSGASNDYRFMYQANEPFRFDHAVEVKVNAADRAGNVMGTHSYAFTTEMRAFGNNRGVSVGSGVSGPNGRPDTVSDPAGAVWAVWCSGDEGNRDVYISRMPAGADTFEAPVAITAAPGDQCHPKIARDNDGILYVVWQDRQRGNWDLFAAASSDNGTTWSRPVQVTDSDGNETHPAIAADTRSPSRVYIAWQDDRDGNADIWAISSANMFVDTLTSRLTTDVADQITPTVDVDASNIAFVVWTDMRRGRADLYGSSSGTTGWANIPIVTTNSQQTAPVIAIDREASILHLLWVDDAPGNTDVYYAALPGLPDSPITGVSVIDDTSGADQLAPAIVCAGGARVFACWQDRRHAQRRPTDTDLFVAELGPDSVGTNIFVGDDRTNSGQGEPAIGIDGYGNPYLVWADARGSNTEIYFAATTFIDPNPLDAKQVVASIGATVGTDPATISAPDDVSIVVPARACRTDTWISISRILNPPVAPADCLGSYDFGPSGVDFDIPVTVTIPYRFSGAGGVKPYWYDSLTGALTQYGITDIENLVIAPNLNALRFKTTHFTPFYVVADTSPLVPGSDGGGGGSGGGCSISGRGDGSPKELLAPYVIVAIAVVVLRRRDRRRRHSIETIQG